MEKTIERFEALFTEFRWGRLVFWIVLALLFFGAGLIVETTTGIRFMWSMDRKIELLTELNDLAKEGVAQDPQLGPIYQSAVRELAGYDVKPLTMSMELDFDFLVKFVAAAAAGAIAMVWLLFFAAGDNLGGGLSGALLQMTREGKIQKPYGLIVLVIFFACMPLYLGACGGLGVLFPTLGNVWVNVGLYIVVGIALWIYAAVEMN